MAAWLGCGGPARMPTTAEWELWLSQARRAMLSARLASHADRTLGLDAVPMGPRQRLVSALRLGERMSQGMQAEALHVAAALSRAGLRCVLLKGTAYLAAGLPPARGRFFGDIDILVPQAQIGGAEAALLAAGWFAHEQEAYHQRYYREWMHEVPPLTHVRRGSVVDLHHTITPPTSAFAIDGARLLEKARCIDAVHDLWILQPTDLVLHSAVHLFSEGEFDHGLRDLLDLADLLRYFGGSEPGFWPALWARAREMALQAPLHHALYHAERLFGPIVPPAWRAEASALRPAWASATFMAWLLAIALRPNHPSCDGPWTPLARWLLYVRAHWLRMPLRLLLPHLLRKAWERRLPTKAVSTP